MIPAALMLVVVMIILMVTMGPLILQAAIRMKASHAVLAAIIERGRPIEFKLLKIIQGERLKDADDEWIVVTDRCRIATYPTFLPKIFAAFTQIVPCQLVLRGRADPLDWESPEAGVMSSKELPAILDPHWMVNLVRGVDEGTAMGFDKKSKQMIFLAVGASCICIIFVLVVLYKLNVTSSQIAELSNQIKLIYP